MALDLSRAIADGLVASVSACAQHCGEENNDGGAAGGEGNNTKNKKSKKPRARVT